MSGNLSALQDLASVGIFGGTFDPIHIGHLRSAIEVRELLACDELRFVPCHRPPHRAEPVANSEQRLRMLELAIVNEPGLAIDTRDTQLAITPETARS